MSVSYSVLSTDRNSDAEVEGLLEERNPAFVKIEPYISPKKKTVLFDIRFEV